MLFVLHVKENTISTVKIGQSDEGMPPGLCGCVRTVYNTVQSTFDTLCTGRHTADGNHRLVDGTRHIDALRAVVNQRAQPVSYTHLDVYKRQALSCIQNLL